MLPTESISIATVPPVRVWKPFWPRIRTGVTLMELLVVMTVMAALIAMAAPSVQRTIEQANADLAGANLRIIWNAQRLFWLENRRYADDLTELVSSGLIDSLIAGGTSRYRLSIVTADDVSFTAAATRFGSTRWSGNFTVDETGVVLGVVQSPGKPGVTPGFE